MARDLLLVRLGERAAVRDPALLEELDAAAAVDPDERPRLPRAARPAAELLEVNVSPELAIDVLLLAWPGRAAAA